MTWAQTMAYASSLGYAGVEPRVEARHAHGIELERTKGERRDLARQASDAGVAICCLATSLRFCDPAKDGSLRESALAYIELASDLECPRLRVFGGPVPGQIDRERAIDIVTNNLREVCGDLDAAGVTLCFETHDDWTDPTTVAKVMRRTDHPNVAVNWDMMHPTRQSGVSIPESYRLLKPWVQHTHIHDGGAIGSQPLRFASMGTGELDVRSFLKLLVSDNYGGYISGEWIDCPTVCDPAKEIEAMKAIERNQTI